jgi:hypothetical protein
MVNISRDRLMALRVLTHSPLRDLLTHREVA